MHQLSKWMRAVRVPTLSASVIPVALGGILGYGASSFNLFKIILAAISVTFFQITANLINDVDDFKNKVDTKESLGSSRVIVDGLLTPKQMTFAAKIFFLTAVAIGIYLTAVSGLVILALGALGAASAYFYTRKPFQFKYKGYGVPIIFLMFGPLPVLGSYYLSTGTMALNPVLLSIPVGLLTTAILHANDLRDIDYDAKAGIKSFAMVLGRRWARRFYLALIAASFICILIFVLTGLVTYWSLLVLLALPPAVMLIKPSGSPNMIKAIDHKTAAVQMLFGLLLLISIAL